MDNQPRAADEPRRADRPQDADELRAADFWGSGAIPLAPDVPGEPDPAIDRLGALPLAIRGRDPVDLLRVAYDAMTSR
jgi:hypothetical protein